MGLDQYLRCASLIFSLATRLSMSKSISFELRILAVIIIFGASLIFPRLRAHNLEAPLNFLERPMGLLRNRLKLPWLTLKNPFLWRNLRRQYRPNFYQFTRIGRGDWHSLWCILRIPVKATWGKFRAHSLRPLAPFIRGLCRVMVNLWRWPSWRPGVAFAANWPAAAIIGTNAVKWRLVKLWGQCHILILLFEILLDLSVHFLRSWQHPTFNIEHQVLNCVPVVIHNFIGVIFLPFKDIFIVNFVIFYKAVFFGQPLMDKIAFGIIAFATADKHTAVFVSPVWSF